MTFDHWHHLDTTVSGGGDGAWIEYRINTGTWNDWTYISPDVTASGGGYTSTMSTDAPSPNGAPSGYDWVKRKLGPRQKEHRFRFTKS